MGCVAGRESRSDGPGERIGAASEWGAKQRGGRGETRLRRAGRGDRGGPGEAIEAGRGEGGT